jgi:dinuclear metal center YbgI/SA1388 family protein
MIIKDIIKIIEDFAPLSLQESYDNSGLLIGDYDQNTDGALISLDITERIIDEAIEKQCNLIISHHPLIFKNIKKINGNNLVERCILKAIKHDIAIYAAHTNLDNTFHGVNHKIGSKIGLQNMRILSPTRNMLQKLVTFVPVTHANEVREALFEAGAGNIGNYSNCSYNTSGNGSFKAGNNTHPFVGTIGEIHYEPEIRIETIFPSYLQHKIIQTLLAIHPYEEPAYDIYPLDNQYAKAGTGMIGDLEKNMEEDEFLHLIKDTFHCKVLKHSAYTGNEVRKVAICGGSGIDFLPEAIKNHANAFLTADIKYHQFFEADMRILLADVGHFESEQFTSEIFYDLLQKKIPTFAVYLSEKNTNPINYL